MFVPPDYNKTGSEHHPLKKIMIPHGMAEAKIGPDIFFQQRCPVNTCTIVRDNPDDADLILFKDYITHVGRRSYNQVSDVTQAILIFATREKSGHLYSAIVSPLNFTYTVISRTYKRGFIIKYIIYIIKLFM